MTNQEIARQFEHLTAALQVLDPKKYFFQIRSYQRAIEILHDLTDEISSIYQDKKDLEFMEGIGPAIESKIVELLETGKCQEIERYTAQMPAGMFPLLDIPGIGAKRAYKLAMLFGFTDPATAIDRLEEIASAGKIRELEGFGLKSEQVILESIARLRHSSGRIPYTQAFSIADHLVKYIATHPAVSQTEPLGSLRRKKTEVGDIDIGLATQDFESVKEHIKLYPKLLRVLADGDNLIRILLKNNIQVDIKSTPPQRWGAFIQHFTGSKDHNIRLREHALKQGKSLSEHGIKLINEDKRLVEFAGEKDFYAYLGLQWITPEQRIGKDEIERAKK